MELYRKHFPHDKHDRIQRLYYDVAIYTIFNKWKLQNIKKKFIKYGIYLINYEKNIVQPEVLRLEHICHIGKYTPVASTRQLQLQFDPTSEIFKTFIAFNKQREKDCIECSRYMNVQKDFNERIDDICIRINDIKKQQNKIRNHYKKCNHCEKMNMVINCGCKSKHKLCSECIYDKPECPVCNEDLNLINCDICMEYKKTLVDTGCANNHKTCKDCLDKISDKRIAKCPFCRAEINNSTEYNEYIEYDYDDYDDYDDIHDY